MGNRVNAVECANKAQKRCWYNIYSHISSYTSNLLYRCNIYTTIFSGRIFGFRIITIVNKLVHMIVHTTFSNIKCVHNICCVVMYIKRQRVEFEYPIWYILFGNYAYVVCSMYICTPLIQTCSELKKREKELLVGFQLCIYANIRQYTHIHVFRRTIFHNRKLVSFRFVFLSILYFSHFWHISIVEQDIVEWNCFRLQCENCAHGNQYCRDTNFQCFAALFHWNQMEWLRYRKRIRRFPIGTRKKWKNKTKRLDSL